MPELQALDPETSRRVFRQAEFRAARDGSMHAIEWTGALLQVLLMYFGIALTRAKPSPIWLMILPALPVIAVLQHWLAYPLLRRRVRHELGTHCPHCDYDRSEEHTSELQSPCNLVCRLLL